jgi:serine/threonine protein kinase
MRDPDGKITLIDFGLAADTSGGYSNTEIVGSPCYIAPEMIKGELCGNKVDMFSFGTVLFVLIFGKMPFRGNTSAEKIQHNMR